MVIDLKKIGLNKIFWSVVTASFAFTMVMFNITMNTIDTNAEYTRDAISDNKKELQIVNADIKEILADTNYIRGIIDGSSITMNQEK